MQLLKVIKEVDVDLLSLFDPSDPVRPEKALLAAILERAIADILSPLYDVGGMDKRAAFRWIWEDNERSDLRPLEPYSFGWICQQLEIDPVRIKHSIVRKMDACEAYERPWNLANQKGEKRAFRRESANTYIRIRRRASDPLSGRKKRKVA